MENSEKINLCDIVDAITEKGELSREESAIFIRELFSTVLDNLSDEKQVEIKDIGTFKLSLTQAHESVDSDTGKTVKTPAHYSLNFMPDSFLNELVNKPFSHFETIRLNEGVTLENIFVGEDKEETEIAFLEDSDLIVVEQEVEEEASSPETLAKESLDSEEFSLKTPISEDAPPEKISAIRIYPSSEARAKRRVRRSDNRNAMALVALGGMVVAITAAAFFFQSRRGDK